MAKVSTYRIEPVTKYQVIESWADEEAKSGGVGTVATCDREEEAQRIATTLHGSN